MLNIIRYILDFGWAHDIPMTSVRIFFMVYFILITIFGISFSKAYVYKGAEDGARWRDLRIWVLVVMAVQIGLYLYF